MKLRILDEQSEDNITDGLDISSTASSTMTWQVLQSLLPHLTKRPAANVTQILQFQALGRKVLDNMAEEKKTKGKSSILDFCTPRRVNDVSRNVETPLESQAGMISTRSVLDVDEIPTTVRQHLA